ncbi:MAG TPA: DUF1540 domain-containing protein [Firmicutes bacterium]|nr:DUF1540 domain-containing protein [Bacillota bacterium]
MDQKEQGKYNACLSNVQCDVTSCMYNNHEHCCTANQIKVGPQQANAQGETVCETYKHGCC